MKKANPKALLAKAMKPKTKKKAAKKFEGSKADMKIDAKGQKALNAKKLKKAKK